MKHSFINRVKASAPLVIALFAFVIFTGNTNPGDKKDLAATSCCTGYNVAMTKLKKFMIDSLHTSAFEGGVYAKADLIAAINKIPGDSVYLLNVVKNCNFSRGIDLAITSPTASGVVFATQPNCFPCPGKACCPQKVCVARINRSCINYVVYNGLTNKSGANSLSAEE
jgi:hypothetical protein